MNREEWNVKHAVCPRCGKNQLRTTLIGVPEIDGEYEDNVNTAECVDCNWSGPVKELVPAGTVENVVMPIKMLDFDGKTYACTEDVVTATLDFNSRLAVTLNNRKDMIDFATAITNEYVKMLIQVDKEHWVNKYKYQSQVNDAAKAAKEKTGVEPTAPESTEPAAPESEKPAE